MNEENAHTIALNLERQLWKNNIVDYDTEGKVNEAVKRFLREEIPFHFGLLSYPC